MGTVRLNILHISSKEDILGRKIFTFI